MHVGTQWRPWCFPWRCRHYAYDYSLSYTQDASLVPWRHSLARRGNALAGDWRPIKEVASVEVRNTAKAFNDMQRRIQRLLNDRERLLRSISSWLKTPITRLRLRAEMLDEDDIAMRWSAIWKIGYVSKRRIAKASKKPIFMKSYEVIISRMLTGHAFHREYTRDQTHRCRWVRASFYG